MCSVETYSSFRRCASSNARSKTLFVFRAQVLFRALRKLSAAARLVSRLHPRAAWATHPAFRAGEAPRRHPAQAAPRGGAAAGSAAVRSAQPISCAACIASWAFTVSLSNLGIVAIFSLSQGNKKVPVSAQPPISRCRSCCLAGAIDATQRVSAWHNKICVSYCQVWAALKRLDMQLCI